MARTPSKLRRFARTGAEITAAAIGLLCCMATSREPEPNPGPPDDVADSDGDDSDGDDDGSMFADIQADLVLHNATDEDQVLRIRRLKTGSTVREKSRFDAIAEREAIRYHLVLSASVEAAEPIERSIIA